MQWLSKSDYGNEALCQPRVFGKRAAWSREVGQINPAPDRRKSKAARDAGAVRARTMTTRAFGVHTPRELLKRAQFEILELEQSVGRHFILEDEGKNKIGSLAATCASSLWNMVDWLANSTDSTTRSALARTGFADYKTIRDHVMASSPTLTLCWEITNGYRHCELKGHTMTASQIDRAALSAPSNWPPNHPLAYRFVPKIKTKAGANLPVLDVYKDALAYWEAFLTGVGL